MTYTRCGGAVAVALLVLFVAGCSSSSDAVSGGGTAGRVEMEARDFSFEPAALTLNAGQPYTLVFKNIGSTLHDWTIISIPARAVATDASAGHDMDMTPPAGSGSLHVAADASKTSELTFTPTQAGEYEYACTVPGHRELGMRGRLVVQS